MRAHKKLAVVISSRSSTNLAMARFLVAALTGFIFASADPDTRCSPGFVWQRSTTASADLCQPTCEDPTPKCDKAPAEGCACNSRRPIWMAHHNACGTLAMCKGVKCNTISCHIDKKTGVTKVITAVTRVLLLPRAR